MPAGLVILKKGIAQLCSIKRPEKHSQSKPGLLLYGELMPKSVFGGRTLLPYQKPQPSILSIVAKSCKVQTLTITVDTFNCLTQVVRERVLQKIRSQLKTHALQDNSQPGDIINSKLYVQQL
jgi:hypothetical protein